MFESCLSSVHESDSILMDTITKTLYTLFSSDSKTFFSSSPHYFSPFLSHWCTGGVEALFLILEDTDVIMQSNALWALTNLCWSPLNQVRVGRYLMEVCVFLSASNSAVQRQAYALLSNVLYYNESNRSKFLEVEGTVEMLLSTYCIVLYYCALLLYYAMLIFMTIFHIRDLFSRQFLSIRLKYQIPFRFIMIYFTCNFSSTYKHLPSIVSFSFSFAFAFLFNSLFLFLLLSQASIQLLILIGCAYLFKSLSILFYQVISRVAVT